MQLEKLIESKQGSRTDLTSQKHLLEVKPPICQAAELAEMSQPTYSKAKFVSEHADEDALFIIGSIRSFTVDDIDVMDVV